jgi:regulator of sigma D
MLAQSVPEEHRRRVDALVQRWLQERQSLIVLMMSLSDEQQRQQGSLPERVQAFCEILMDYVSAGHFEVYDELLAEAELRNGGQPASGQELLSRLQPTTDAVIRFNDIYEDAHDETALARLSRELSLLGPEMESRFETEDRMIALLHDSAGRTTALGDTRLAQP